MKPLDRYNQLLVTDPTVGHVAEDIARGARWLFGETDVHAHLPLLRSLAKGNVLEIGVRFGASTAALLTGLEEHGGLLHSIDVADCKFARSLFSDHPQWVFLQGDSRNPVINSLLPKEFDLVFIDGDHTFAGVMSDLRMYGHRAKKIALHDYNPFSGAPVTEAVARYMNEESKFRTLVSYGESNGLAILS